MIPRRVKHVVNEDDFILEEVSNSVIHGGLSEWGEESYPSQI